MSDSLKKAAQGIIDVWFTPSTSDLRILVRLDPDRPFYIVLTVLSRLGAFALAAGLTLAGLWASGLLDQDMVQNLTLAVAGGLIGIVAFRLLVEKAWRRHIHRSLFKPSRHMHVTSNGQALTIEDEHAQSRIAFSGIDRVIEVPTHLVLYQDRTSIIALPKAAFGKPEDFKAFASFLKNLVAAHHTHQPISEKTS